MNNIDKEALVAGSGDFIAGIKVKHRYNLYAPKGVRGRNSDNTLIKECLDWAPEIRLAEGLEPTYRWIHDRMTGT